MDLQNLFYGTVHVIFTRRFRMKHLHRECSTRNSISWCISVEIGELEDVNMRTSSAAGRYSNLLCRHSSLRK
jgi:hypothetical protein